MAKNITDELAKFAIKSNVKLEFIDSLIVIESADGSKACGEAVYANAFSAIKFCKEN